MSSSRGISILDRRSCVLCAPLVGITRLFILFSSIAEDSFNYDYTELILAFSES
jgi:hypothetical protein